MIEKWEKILESKFFFGGLFPSPLVFLWEVDTTLFWVMLFIVNGSFLSNGNVELFIGSNT